MNKIVIMGIVWVAVAIFAGIVEALTVSVVSCWFSVGAVFALGADILKQNLLVQLILFVVVSLLTMLIIRPILTKRSKAKMQPTNADMLIGKEAIVTEEIDNINQKGAVKINGLVWTARSEDGTPISKGSIVRISKIEGAKLIVIK